MDLILYFYEREIPKMPVVQTGMNVEWSFHVTIKRQIIYMKRKEKENADN